MMKALLILFALSSFAQEPPFLKGLSVKEKGLSSELEVMVEQLAKSEAITFSEAREVVDSAQVINADLSKSPRANALFLIKSEIYKSLLNGPLLPKKSRVTLSSSLLSSVKAKLKKHALIYGPFSKWVMDSVESELAPYIADGFIDKYQSVSGNDVKARTRSMELKKLAKYLGPWIVEFLDRGPEEFNSLTDQIAAASIKALARKGFYFSKFSDDYSTSMNAQVFSVPSLKSPAPNTDSGEAQKNKGLKEAKKARIKQGEEIIEKLGPESDDPSAAIDELLDSSEEDQKDEKKKAWKPR